LQLELPAGPAAPTDQAPIDQPLHGAGARRRRAPGLSLDRVALAGTAEHPCSMSSPLSAIAAVEKPNVIVEAPTGALFLGAGGEYLDGGHARQFQLRITARYWRARRSRTRR